jgi:hypothetical protein
MRAGFLPKRAATSTPSNIIFTSAPARLCRWMPPCHVWLIPSGYQPPPDHSSLFLKYCSAYASTFAGSSKLEMFLPSSISIGNALCSRASP